MQPVCRKTRYGAVVLDGSSKLPTAPQRSTPEDGLHAATASGVPGSLAYGVLVNASAVHGAPIFMNLVNSAALQVVTAGAASGGEEEGASSTDALPR